MVGQHIGKYRVTSEIGRGGMGTVFHAVDETLQREVAIKVLNTGLADPTVARRFRAEAVTVARLNHPGIATIYELLQHDGQWLMVMEFVRGETLESLATRKGPLPVNQAADLLMQALAALAHAHSLGVVHRDLKPANLMLADSGLVKIMDFGIARVAGAEQLTSIGLTMGTPAYMSPEQVLGQEIDARTDLYAIGLIFYLLTTGRLPFNGKTPLEIAQARLQDTPTPASAARGDLPPWVGHVTDIALARPPEQRYQTALFFREALRRGVANLPLEHQVLASTPPELVATAAPNSLPIPGVATPTPVAMVRHTMPPAAETPTVASSATSAPAVTAPDSADAGRSSAVGWGLAAAAVVVVVGASFFLMSGSTGEPAAVSTVAPPPSEAVVPETPPVMPPPPATTPSSAPSPAPAAAVAAGSPTGSVPASATGSRASGSRGAGTPAPSAPASALAPASASKSPAAPASTAGATNVAAASAARGRGRATAPAVPDTPTAFKDVRAFVVSGRRVEEREASLQIGNGLISVTNPQGGITFGSLAYADITGAAYSRGKNPVWYPTLAGPPSDVDLPGGLFRSDRHWLALQSRSGYLIVRLNDDFRRVVDVVGGRIGVSIDTLAPRGQ